jgi:hypothetical protein
VKIGARYQALKSTCLRFNSDPGHHEKRLDPLIIERRAPPGKYEVLVEADGYQSQRRKISVDPQGVVILNADLPKKP